jgi:hypothetical protein
MQYSEYPAINEDNLSFIYSGLSKISEKGRKHLKNMAQTLIAMQNRPGTPVPDSICREILHDKNCRPEFGKGRFSLSE